MPIPSIDYRNFGSGGSDLTPNNSAGKPWVGQILEATREDAFYPRFDWSTAVSAPASSDLATLVALVVELSQGLVAAAPAGAAAFLVRGGTISYTVGNAEEEAAALAEAIRSLNALKAALLATASVDYTATVTSPDATDQATAITLANEIRTALGI